MCNLIVMLHRVDFTTFEILRQCTVLRKNANCIKSLYVWDISYFNYFYRIRKRNQSCIWRNVRYVSIKKKQIRRCLEWLYVGLGFQYRGRDHTVFPFSALFASCAYNTFFTWSCFVIIFFRYIFAYKQTCCSADALCQV